MICEPDRNCCIPYIMVPDGVHAVIMSSGAYAGLATPGMNWAGPFTEIKYLVSKQDFVYESPNVRVFTGDNLPVEISLSLVMKVVARGEQDDTEKNASQMMQLVTNVN